MIFVLATGLLLSGSALQYLLRYLALRRITGDCRLDSVWRYGGVIAENQRERWLRSGGIGVIGAFGGLGLIAESLGRPDRGAYFWACVIACLATLLVYALTARRASQGEGPDAIYQVAAFDE
jgi:hypothetical protein